MLPGASELFRRTDTSPSVPEVTELPSLSDGSSPRLRSSPVRPRSRLPLTLVPGGAASGDADALASFRSALAGADDAAEHPHGAVAGASHGPHQARREDHRLHLRRTSSWRWRAAGSPSAGSTPWPPTGAIVREAIAVILADLDERGEDSVLVHRLKGR